MEINDEFMKVRKNCLSILFRREMLITKWIIAQTKLRISVKIGRKFHKLTKSTQNTILWRYFAKKCDSWLDRAERCMFVCNRRELEYEAYRKETNDIVYKYLHELEMLGFNIPEKIYKIVLNH